MTQRRYMVDLLALLTLIVVAALIYVGSRGLRDFDAALIGYAVGTTFAIVGMVYRYTLWLGRPPTGRYFRAGWRNFLSWKNFRRYTFLIPKLWWTDIFAQTFIFRRGVWRWLMHMSIFWGVVISLLVTIPLTFGWFHLTLVGRDDYRIWFFGLSLFRFPLGTPISWSVFHVLDYTAFLLLFGLAIAFWRRTNDAGLLATQRFSFDLMPLILLFAIAITGLALTASQMLWAGRYYAFISITHEVVVVVWLISLPFGKFFHIVERPATIGITLYNTVNQDIERSGPELEGSRCARCGEALPSQQFVRDLKATLVDLGQRYDMAERGVLQDYCPTCKRVLRGTAYYELMQKQFL
ncbi:MAG TPA: MFS transporter [Dehalococcoidia bacterium]|nr:MFS transporter [Dehalococcoidia bacterium]